MSSPAARYVGHAREPFRQSYSFASVSSDTTVKLYKVEGRALRIERVMINLPAGQTADASNYVNFKILNGAAVAANWSTQTGTNGTLSADTPADMVITAANEDIVDGTIMSFFIDTTGTITVPAGLIVVEGHLL